MPSELDYKCVMNEMKEIKIRNFVGDEDELALMKFLLLKGSALETVHINFKKEAEILEKSEEVIQKLITFPRASATARLLFQT